MEEKNYLTQIADFNSKILKYPEQLFIDIYGPACVDQANQLVQAIYRPDSYIPSVVSHSNVSWAPTANQSPL